MELDNQKHAIKHVLRVIQTINRLEHIEPCERLINNFVTLYGKNQHSATMRLILRDKTESLLRLKYGF